MESVRPLKEKNIPPKAAPADEDERKWEIPVEGDGVAAVGQDRSHGDTLRAMPGARGADI